MISFLLYELGGALAQVFPLGLTYGIAILLANLNFLFNRTSRRAVIANLKHVLKSVGVQAEAVAGGASAAGPWSHADLDRIARRVFRNFALNIADFLRFPLFDLHSLREVVTLEGWEHIERANAAGRGFIILSAHVGNWEMCGAVLGLSGLRVRAVALDHGAGRVTRFYAKRRRGKGVESLPVTGSTFAMLEWLRGGGAVALVGDRDFTHQGKPVPFFGQTAIMPRAHASLGLKTGAPVLPIFLVREAGHRFRLIIRPPVSTVGLPATDRVRAFMERCLRVFEDVIRRYPEQWCVFVPIWDGPDAVPALSAARRGRAPTGAPA